MNISKKFIEETALSRFRGALKNKKEKAERYEERIKEEEDKIDELRKEIDTRRKRITKLKGSRAETVDQIKKTGRLVAKAYMKYLTGG